MKMPKAGEGAPAITKLRVPAKTHEEQVERPIRQGGDVDLPPLRDERIADDQRNPAPAPGGPRAHAALLIPDTKGDLETALADAEKHFGAGALELARGAAQSAIDLALRLKDESARAKALGILGDATFLGGKMTEGRKLIQEAIEAAHAARDFALEGRLLGRLGVIYHDQGNLAAAARFYARSTKVARESGIEVDLARALGNEGYELRDLGRSEEALARFTEALNLTKELGDPEGWAGTWAAWKGISHEDLGQMDKAIAAYTEALTFSDPGPQALADIGLGRVALREGKNEEAQEKLRAAAELVTKHEIGWLAFVPPILLGILDMREGGDGRKSLETASAMTKAMLEHEPSAPWPLFYGAFASIALGERDALG
jgi:tetratricopeptide (TPR) repeat protein